MVSLLGNKGSCVDGSDTGTGKTYIFSAIISSLAIPLKKVVVIGEKSNIEEVRKVMKDHFNLPIWEIAFKTKSMVSNLYRGQHRQVERAVASLSQYDFFVIDEAHILRNSKNIFTQVFLKLAKEYPNKHFYLASATLVESPLNLMGIKCVLDPNFNFYKFYFKTWQRRVGMKKAVYFSKGFKTRREQDMKLVVEEMSPYVSRMKKESFGLKKRVLETRKYDWKEVIDVVGKEYVALKKEIDLLEQKIRFDRAKIEHDYQADKRSVLESGKPLWEKSAMLQNLEYGYKNVLKTKENERFSKEKRLQKAYERSVERARLDRVLVEAMKVKESGKSVVLFVNFRDNLNYIKGEMYKQGLSFGVIQGNDDAKERQLHIERFNQDKIHIILCMMGAGSIGISLHDVIGTRQRVMFICSTYDATKFLQALGRTHRVGAKTEAHIIITLVNHDVETRREKRLKEKLSNIYFFNKENNNKENQMIEMSKEEETKSVSTTNEGFVSKDQLKQQAIDLVPDVVRMGTVKIKGNLHVKKEGWAFMALTMGINAGVDKTEEIREDGKVVGYLARSVVRNNKGHTIGGGEGECRFSEKGKATHTHNAVRAMAQTRACNRGLNHVLSGLFLYMQAKDSRLQSCPAEEMEYETSSSPKVEQSPHYEAKYRALLKEAGEKKIPLSNTCLKDKNFLNDIYKKRTVTEEEWIGINSRLQASMKGPESFDKAVASAQSILK